MLRVNWETTRYSKKYRKYGYADSVDKTISYDHLLDVVHEVQAWGDDMYPLMVKLTPVDATKAEQLFIGNFVVYASDEHYTASQHNWDTIPNALVLEKPVCCFCRMLEDMYLRHVNSHIDYVPGMHITKAREARNSVLGVKASAKFCWDQKALGNLPKLFDGFTALCGKFDQGPPFNPPEEKQQKGFVKSSVISPMKHEKHLENTNHQSAAVRATSPLLKTRVAPVTPRSIVSEAESKVSQSAGWPVLSSDIMERNLSDDRLTHDVDIAVTDPVETTVPQQLEGNIRLANNVVAFVGHEYYQPSLEEIEELEYLGDLYDIIPNLRNQYRFIKMIDLGYRHLTEAYPPVIMHPWTFLLLRTISQVSDPLVIAKEWYMTVKNGGLPVVSVPEELELRIRNLDSERLKAIFLLAEVTGINSETVCELCDDIQSHQSDQCIRYMSYSARVEKMGKKCIGCGKNGCVVGNRPHSARRLKDPCQKCGSHEPNQRFRHEKYLCNDAVRWAQKRQQLVGLACLAEATWTWTKEDYHDIAKYHKGVKGLASFVEETLPRYV